MRFQPDLVPADAHKLLNRFIAIVGWNVWKKRFNELDQQRAQNIFLDDFISDSFVIEKALQQAAAYREKHNRWLIKRPDQIDYPMYKLLGFASTTARVYARLSLHGQSRLRGMLRDGLKNDRGLSAIAFEMEVAGHLLRRGFDVQFHDLEHGKFDFIACLDGIEIEVECKRASADVGRQIHRRRMAQLGGHFTRSWSGQLDDGGHFLRVTLPDRLHGEDQIMHAIAETAILALGMKSNFPGPTPCTVQYQSFNLAGTPLEGSVENINIETVHRFTEARFAVPNPQLLIMLQPSRAALLMAVESRKPDQMLKGLYRQLKTGADQLSKNRPGILCVLLADISGPQLIELANAEAPTGLQVTTSELLEAEHRRHLHTIAYMAQSDLVASNHILGSHIQRGMQARGPTYTFKNRHHPAVADPRLDVFDLLRSSTVT
ncbi:hypothetical protein [Inquilinus sp. CAU 1745]|uniref:hypothetical protein n=1 Tax=Inquilinus sp. CAU 1745 TaxID=3140369 RepID=UPI00325B1590